MSKVRCIAGLILAAAVTGCTTPPLSSPDAAKVDKRFIGTWLLETDDEQVQCNIKAAIDPARKGWMVIPESEEPDSYFFTTTIDGRLYVNLLCPDDEDQLEAPPTDAEGESEFYVLACRFHSKDRFSLRPISDDWAKRAVKSGRLKGETGLLDCRITDTTENFARVIKEDGDGKVFEKDVLIRFTRVNE